MTFRPAEIIAKKRDGLELTDQEISFFISNLSSFGDDQIGAFLMAVFIRGMTDLETTSLTRHMLGSGAALDWSGESFSSLVVDKHSTGGVGDKVSLPLAPALAACGAKVPMISGRGLGHTGGTLDKLEAIPGFSVTLTEQRLKEVIREVGCAICGQTASVCPADKKLYAIRDVTATVESIPLITGSIVCKKAAEGLRALVLDCKVGRAAFMRTEEASATLARSMVAAGNGLGIKTQAVLTEMDNPIGLMVGNSLEVAESIHCLRGQGPADLEELVCVEGGLALASIGLAATAEAGQAMIKRSLHDGTALAKFRAMVQAQGGNPQVCDVPDPMTLMPRASHTEDLLSPVTGYVTGIHAMDVALASLSLGAGRTRKEDVLDLGVGIQLLVTVGDHIEKGKPWARVHHSGNLTQQIRAMVDNTTTLEVSPEKPPQKSRIIRII
jgi:pyrimidine-nucleoside phosphorylase